MCLHSAAGDCKHIIPCEQTIEQVGNICTVTISIFFLVLLVIKKLHLGLLAVQACARLQRFCTHAAEQVELINEGKRGFFFCFLFPYESCANLVYTNHAVILHRSSNLGT